MYLYNVQDKESIFHGFNLYKQTRCTRRLHLKYVKFLRIFN